MRRMMFILFSPNEQRGGWGGRGGGATRLFSSSLFFPVQQTTSGIGHRVIFFSGLATNTLNVRNNNNNYTIDPLAPLVLPQLMINCSLLVLGVCYPITEEYSTMSIYPYIYYDYIIHTSILSYICMYVWSVNTLSPERRSRVLKRGCKERIETPIQNVGHIKKFSNISHIWIDRR